jgi:hypothetical protein
MSLELIRRPSRAALNRHDEDLTLALRRAPLPAQIATVKLNAAAMATHAALLNTALLSAEESRLISQVPLAEPRLKVIVDGYAGLAAHVIGRLAHE